jgi:hypothetical protein
MQTEHEAGREKLHRTVYGSVHYGERQVRQGAIIHAGPVMKRSLIQVNFTILHDPMIIQLS